MLSYSRGRRGPKSAPGRDGGLKPAHLAAAQWLAKATGAGTEGMKLKSTELVFRPSTKPEYAVGGETSRLAFKTVSENGAVVRRDTWIEMSTPGSIPLILQAILPYLLFGGFDVPLRVNIEGGTNVSNSPTIDYVMLVLLPTLQTHLGIHPISVTIHKRGWSVGRTEVGLVTLDIVPWQHGRKLPTFTFSRRGPVTKLHVSILGPNRELRGIIRSKIDEQTQAGWPNVDLLFTRDEDSGHIGRIYLLLVAETEAGYRLGCDRLYEMKPPKKSGGKAKLAQSEARRQAESLTVETIER